LDDPRGVFSTKKWLARIEPGETPQKNGGFTWFYGTYLLEMEVLDGNYMGKSWEYMGIPSGKFVPVCELENDVESSWMDPH
jgi:hypothetical protein